MSIVYNNLRNHNNQEIRGFHWGLEGFENIYYKCVSLCSFACFELSFETSENLMFPLFPCWKLFLVKISYIVIGTHWLAKFNLCPLNRQNAATALTHTTYGACFSKPSITLSPESLSTSISLGLRLKGATLTLPLSNMAYISAQFNRQTNNLIKVILRYCEFGYYYC